MRSEAAERRYMVLKSQSMGEQEPRNHIKFVCLTFSTIPCGLLQRGYLVLTKASQLHSKPWLCTHELSNKQSPWAAVLFAKYGGTWEALGQCGNSRYKNMEMVENTNRIRRSLWTLSLRWPTFLTWYLWSFHLWLIIFWVSLADGPCVVRSEGENEFRSNNKGWNQVSTLWCKEDFVPEISSSRCLHKDGNNTNLTSEGETWKQVKGLSWTRYRRKWALTKSMPSTE